MAIKKENWTNVVKYAAEDYLSTEEQIELKNEIEALWRLLGWINLRMTNDINIHNKTPLSKPEIRRRLTGIQEKMKRCADVYLKEDE